MNLLELLVLATTIVLLQEWFWNYKKKLVLFVCLFIQWFINLCGLFDAKEIVKGISAKVNAVARLEFELTNYDVAINHFSNNAIEDSLSLNLICDLTRK